MAFPTLPLTAPPPSVRGCLKKSQLTLVLVLPIELSVEPYTHILNIVLRARNYLFVYGRLKFSICVFFRSASGLHLSLHLSLHELSSGNQIPRLM
jgi:hypothetical protein